MHNEPENLPYPIYKQLFDKLLAVTLFIISFPVFILIAFLIKFFGLIFQEDAGFIFYSERRVSHGKYFKLIKFRTLKMSVMQELYEQGKGSINRIKDRERNDENCTRIGVYLKNFYLDELPQLINILKGDLSFVGPRPWPIKDYENELERGIDRKKIIKCGLTGLVQINKGKYKNLEEEIALDYAYIEHIKTHSGVRNLFYDLYIIWKSFKVLFEGKGL